MDVTGLTPRITRIYRMRLYNHRNAVFAKHRTATPMTLETREPPSKRKELRSALKNPGNYYSAALEKNQLKPKRGAFVEVELNAERHASGREIQQTCHRISQ